MRKFVKILIILIVVALAAPFFIKDRHGRPLMRISYFKPKQPILPDIPDVKGMLQTAGKMLPKPAAAPEKPSKAYRWRDAEGKLHFSDRPNPNGPSEEIAVNPAANVVPAQPSAGESIPATARPERPRDKKALAIPSLTTVPIGQVPRMIDDANTVKALAGDQEEERLKLLAQ